MIEPAGRNESYQYGLMFTELGAEAKRQLEAYVMEASHRHGRKADEDNGPPLIWERSAAGFVPLST